MKVIVLVDGEHHPSVTRWAIASARAAGYQVLVAVFVGGVEKLGPDEDLDIGGVALATGDPRAALEQAIGALAPDAVLDLSDEPVLGHERRMELAAVTLARGVPYIGPDFRFDPPITEPPLPVPTVGVIGTGKRVGKTAVSAHLARIAAAAGRGPAIVAMGRGGPAAPVPAGPADVTLAALIERADRGEHAASDYLEDAATAGVPAVGARRAGGGLAGRPFVTNAAAAADLAVAGGAGLVILEGSGSALPPVAWDAGVLVTPATRATADLTGYLGPLRVLLSDLVVFMLGTGSITGPDDLSSLASHVRRLVPDIEMTVAELQPVVLGDVTGRDAFFATTARGEAAVRLAEQIERTAGCRIVMRSDQLGDRTALEDDLRLAPHFDVLLTELKSAAIDVAARRALERGAEVMFVENRPRSRGGDGDVDDLLIGTIERAERRAAARTGAEGNRRP